MSHSQLLFLAILSVLINTGYCIKCYNCISNVNPDCKDPINKLQPQECTLQLLQDLSSKVDEYAKSIAGALKIDIDINSKPSEGAMVCQKMESVTNGETVIVRSCQIKDMGEIDTCANVKKITPSTTHCSTCHEDGCNSGHWMTPLSILTLLTPVILSSIWSRYV